MSHCLKRREPEALIQRRKHERLCDIVKNTQHLDRNEPKKAHILLHSAANYRAPQSRMAGKVVADDNQLEVLELPIFRQLALQGRKRFDNAYHVFVRPDRSRIKDERMIHLVALCNQPAIAIGGVSMQKA